MNDLILHGSDTPAPDEPGWLPAGFPLTSACLATC